MLTGQELKQVTAALVNGIMYYDVSRECNVISINDTFQVLNTFCREVQIIVDEKDGNKIHIVPAGSSVAEHPTDNRKTEGPIPSPPTIVGASASGSAL